MQSFPVKEHDLDNKLRNYMHTTYRDNFDRQMPNQEAMTLHFWKVSEAIERMSVSSSGVSNFKRMLVKLKGFRRVSWGLLGGMSNEY